MKLAFVILAHNDPDNVLRLIKRLAADGDRIVVHWDKKSRFDIEARARQELTAEQWAAVHFCRRVVVAWGRWSMVEATLSALNALADMDETFDYVILLSGADYPLRPLKGLKQFLVWHPGKEFIECVDPEKKPWVVQGLVKERFLHHHWFSWRDQRPLFEWSLATQKKLGIKRRLPNQLKAYFGSQWWALTWPTVKQVLALSRQGSIRRFFKTTWVPDEMFFQTLVAAVAPEQAIAGTSLTFYHFDHTGKPLTLYNDHFDFLRKQNFFFARKLSPQAGQLRDELDKFIAENPDAGIPWPAKSMDDFQKFMAVQWRGIPGRRVFGKQLDVWYGDLEWNIAPYFVILAYPQAQLRSLTHALNALPGIRCFGELFVGNAIDYGLPDGHHPCYPSDKPALRDMKRPNFLVDLIRANPRHLIGFVLRLPTGNEMERVVLYDKLASIFFVLPDDRYYQEGQQQFNWSSAFHNMIMQDHLAEARRANKPFLTVKASGHMVAHDGVERLKSQLIALRDTFGTGKNFEIY